MISTVWPTPQDQNPGGPSTGSNSPVLQIPWDRITNWGPHLCIECPGVSRPSGSNFHVLPFPQDQIPWCSPTLRFRLSIGPPPLRPLGRDSTVWSILVPRDRIPQFGPVPRIEFPSVSRPSGSVFLVGPSRRIGFHGYGLPLKIRFRGVSAPQDRIPRCGPPLRIGFRAVACSSESDSAVRPAPQGSDFLVLSAPGD